MAAAMSPINSSALSAGQGPGSTAAVLEYVCLFTHDLKRKQKRWQDGRLKYHTFNKRVVVHDERGNYVGDMHWRFDYDFDEGEEVQLERGGVIVQVAECVGRRDQDLSELLDKRVEEREQRHRNAASRTPMPISRPPIRPPQLASSRPLHRPLHAVIGTPTGHHGRAVAPIESPYEQRQQQTLAGEPSNPPLAKRRKYDEPPSKSGYARSLFGATLTLSCEPVSSMPPRDQPDENSISDEENRRVDQGVRSIQNRQEASSPQRSQDRAKHSDALPGRSAHQRVRTLHEPRQPSKVLPSAVDPALTTRKQPAAAASRHGQEQARQRIGKANGAQRESGDDSRSETVSKDARNQQRKQDRARQPSLPPDDSIIELVSSPDMPNNRAPPVRRTDTREKSHRVPSVDKGKRKAAEPTMATAKRQEVSKARDAGNNQEKSAEVKTSEPKTALRIKPRQKRGLLMVAEKSNTANKKTSTKEVAPHEKRAEVASHHSIDDSFASSPPAAQDDVFTASPPAAQTRRRETPEPDKRGRKDVLRDVSPNISRPNSRRLKRKNTANLDDEEMLTIDSAQEHGPLSDAESEVPIRKKRTKTVPPKPRAKKRRDVDIQDESSNGDQRTGQVETRPKKPSGPRLATVKKSVKSKEIIGFPFQENGLSNGSLRGRGYLEQTTIPNTETQNRELARDSGETGNGSINQRHEAPTLVTETPETLAPVSRAAQEELGNQNQSIPPTVTNRPTPMSDKHEIPSHMGESATTSAGDVEDPRKKGEQLSTTSEARISPSVTEQLLNPQHTRATSRRHSLPAGHPTEPSATSHPPNQAIPPLTRQKSDSHQDPNPRPALLPQSNPPAPHTTSKPPPRIVNPATRGRKAALKSDAAGQVPQNVLPPADPVVQTRVIVLQQDGVVRPVDEAPPPPQPAKRKMRFPGFVSANQQGGPWSREAGDLLDGGRVEGVS